MAAKSSVLRTLQTFLQKSLSQADLMPPIYRVFFTSWVIFNWRAIYYVFASSDDAAAKLRTIDSIYVHLGSNLLYPLALTILYLSFSPAIKNLFTFAWTFSDRKSSRRLLSSMKTKIPLTEDEQIEHMELVEDMLRQRDEVIEELERKNKNLRTINQKLLASVGLVSAKNSPQAEQQVSTLMNDSDAELTRNDLVEFINSTDGNYHLMKYIAPKLLLEIDDSGHKKELDTFLAITKSIIAEYPDGWLSKELNVNGTRYNPTALRSWLKKMEHAGLIETSSKSGVPEAKISSSLLDFLKRNIQK